MNAWTFWITGPYAAYAMIAIGKHGKKEDLPDMYWASEVVSDRRPMNETVTEGTFSFKK